MLRRALDRTVEFFGPIGMFGVLAASRTRLLVARSAKIPVASTTTPSPPSAAWSAISDVVAATIDIIIDLIARRVARRIWSVVNVVMTVTRLRQVWPIAGVAIAEAIDRTGQARSGFGTPWSTASWAGIDRTVRPIVAAIIKSRIPALLAPAATVAVNAARTIVTRTIFTRAILTGSVAVAAKISAAVVSSAAGPGLPRIPADRHRAARWVRPLRSHWIRARRRDPLRRSVTFR